MAEVSREWGWTGCSVAAGRALWVAHSRQAPAAEAVVPVRVTQRWWCRPYQLSLWPSGAVSLANRRAAKEE